MHHVCQNSILQKYNQALYFTLSNASIAEVDTGHFQHWYIDFRHTNLKELQVNHPNIKNYQQATLHILLFFP